MTPYTVVVVARAEEHARTIHEWWQEHRAAAPTLFVDELDHAFQRLTKAPHAGHPYPIQAIPDIRRLLLRRTRYHVYYAVDDTARVLHRIRAGFSACRQHLPRPRPRARMSTDTNRARREHYRGAIPLHQQRGRDVSPLRGA